MSTPVKNTLLFAGLVLLFIMAGVIQSWTSAFDMLVVGLASAIMALGVNMQWGYAGLFNVGVMGFAALGSLAMVLIATTLRPAAWAAGGWMLLIALAVGAATIALAVWMWNRMPKGRLRTIVLLAILFVGFLLYRWAYIPGSEAVEAFNGPGEGNLGGLGVVWFFHLFGLSTQTAQQLAVWVSWPVGGLIAAGAAWLIAKTALGLRSDYLAIATLGIAEIVVTILKNEDWLDRGVKTVFGLPHPFPVPDQIVLQQNHTFAAMAQAWGLPVSDTAAVTVELAYCVIFALILAVVLTLAELALKSPWGRMIRAIRDNEDAAEAMGKDVKFRHLQVFVIGSALIGIAGAMLTSYSGLFSPTTYQPLRWTFLIWVMVIVGGSGNNWGSVLGGLLIWFLWIEVEPLGNLLLAIVTDPMPNAWPLKEHLLNSAQHMRLMTMGIILLLVLRFSPKGLIPEK